LLSPSFSDPPFPPNVGFFFPEIFYRFSLLFFLPGDVFSFKDADPRLRRTLPHSLFFFPTFPITLFPDFSPLLTGFFFFFSSYPPWLFFFPFCLLTPLRKVLNRSSCGSLLSRFFPFFPIECSTRLCGFYYLGVSPPPGIFWLPSPLPITLYHTLNSLVCDPGKPLTGRPFFWTGLFFFFRALFFPPLFFSPPSESILPEILGFAPQGAFLPPPHSGFPTSPPTPRWHVSSYVVPPKFFSIPIPPHRLSVGPRPPGVSPCGSSLVMPFPSLL